MVAFTHMGWQKMMGVGGGGIEEELLFNAINPRPDGTISVEPYKGEGSATFIRSTVGDFVIDSDGIYRGVAANEARIQGARRVENLHLESNTLDTSPWADSTGGGAIAAVETNNYGIAPDGSLTASRLQLDLDGNTTTGDISQRRQTHTNTGSYTYSLWMKSNTSSVVVQVIDPTGGGVAITVTTSWQRFSVTGEQTAGVSYGIRLRGGQAPTNADSCDILVWGVQLENSSGASNTAPSEYIPTTTAAVAKYYWKTNGNSVTSNVVTEAAGIPLHPVVSKAGANVLARYATRANTTVYNVGDRMIIAAGSGTAGGDGKWYYIDTGDNGTSAGSEGTFDDTIGNTTVDGTATWTCGGHYTLAGYLGEPASTNVILQSRAFDTTWTGPALHTQDQTGIDGVANTAWTLEDDDGAASEVVQQSVAVPDDSNTHTEYVYFLKDSDTSRFPALRLRLTGGTTQEAYYQINTQTGAVSDVASVGTFTGEAIDDGLWWKLVVTVANNGTGNTTSTTFIYPSNGTVFGIFSTAATGTCVVDQAQLELNTSVPSSPIITTTVAVEREADDLSYPDHIVDAQGTLFASVIIDDSTQASNGRIITDITSNFTHAFISTTFHGYYDGTNQQTTANTYTAGKSGQLATRWNAVTSKAQPVLDGGAGGEGDYDGSWNMTGIDVLHRASGNYVQGTISDIRIYKKDLGQTVCEGVTAYD